MPNIELLAVIGSLACVLMKHPRRNTARSLAGAAVVSFVVAGCAGAGATGPSQASTSEPSAATTSEPTTPPTRSIVPTPTASISSTTRSQVPKASSTVAPRAVSTLSLRLVPKFIDFPQRRKDEMAAYSLRHYGARTWRLDPSMIVLHFTETDTASAARNGFQSDSPNLGELPGTCAHFIVAQNGDVWQIVPTSVRCRHTIGLNDKAIGIEIVQSTHGNTSHWADQQILGRPAQIGAVLALVRSLQRAFGIGTSNIIGHATANDSPLFRDLQGWRNDHTDWQAQDVLEVRRRLSATP